MSIKQMQKVWENKELDSTKKLIMLSLCDNANDEGFCYPSITTTCEKTGLSRPTVIKHQKELEEAGYLVSKKRNRKNGGRTSTIYVVFPHENMDLLDDEIKSKFHKNITQSKKALLPPQSKAALPHEGGQSKAALPHEPSLSLYNHHIFKELPQEEKGLFLEYLQLRKKMKVHTTMQIINRLLKKYDEFGRDKNVIIRAINSNWKDFYAVEKNLNKSSGVKKRGRARQC